MKTIRKNLPAIVAFASALLAISISCRAATEVRLSINEPLVPELARALGAFAAEGLYVKIMKVEDVSHEDYLMQEPLVNGKLDASYHWFQHVVFGARHNLPLKAVVMVNDSPGMKIMVANRVKDQIKGAADFKGRNVAEGAGYATKSLLTNFIARRGGVPKGGYTPVMVETEGRQEAVLKGLRDGRVDVMSFMEPISGAIEATGLTTTLFDLTNRAGTIQALGDVWPAHTVFLSAKFIEAHPETVQHLVNAIVRTLRFANTHSAEEIAAKLPASYFTGKDRTAEIGKIRKQQASIAHGDYRLPASAVMMMTEAIAASDFDQSGEGVWRRTGENKMFKAEDLFDNRFVEQAMKTIK